MAGQTPYLKNTRGLFMLPNFDGQKLIVVGGAGYIGSHVCKMLAAHGGKPITFDNFSSGHEYAVKWGAFENVDLRDATATDKAIKKHKDATAVIHLASSIEVGLGEKNPADFYNNNVIGAYNLLETMRNSSIDRLIFSSTCAIYGEADQMPLTEDTPKRPLSVYGKTKLAIEHMIQSYHKAYDLNYITFRYFNAAGADPSGEIGEEHDPETHLIPIALSSAAGLRGRMKIFGSDYDTPDGTCIRDYIHINDLARAHICGLEKFDQGLTQAELNLGTGKGYSNLQVLETIKNVTGLELPYDDAPRRGGDLSQLYADARQAKTVLGFEPQESELKNIIQTAWNFHKRKWGL